MNTDKGRAFSRAGLIWILAIAAASLAARLVSVLQFTGHPLGRFPWVDEGAYWRRALEILAGRWLPDRPYYQDPLFPYFLAGLIRLVGPDVAVSRVALACVGAVTPLAIYWAGKEILGRAPAVVAGLAAAVYGPLVFSDGLLEKEGIGALVAALALGVSARAVRLERGLVTAAAAGLAWGVLSLLRANALAFGPLGAAWLFLARRGLPSGRATAHALLFLGGFCAALLPVTVVNLIVSEPPELIVTTWQAGANFYLGMVRRRREPTRCSRSSRPSRTMRPTTSRPRPAAGSEGGSRSRRSRTFGSGRGWNAGETLQGRRSGSWPGR